MRTEYKKKKNKKVLVIAASFLLLLLIVFLGGFIGIKYNKIKNQAEQILTIVESGDVEELEKALLGTESLEADEEFEEILPEEQEDSGGFITWVLEQDAVKVKKIKKDIVVYEVTAPDLSRVFQEISPEISTEDEFEKIMRDYIKNAPQITTTVELSYSVNNDVLEIDYKNEKFFNALTGNMLVSYQKLIEGMFEEYVNGDES